jgi:hypothetical protein
MRACFTTTAAPDGRITLRADSVETSAQLRFTRHTDEFHAAVDDEKWCGENGVLNDALDRVSHMDVAHFHARVARRDLPDESFGLTAAWTSFRCNKDFDKHAWLSAQPYSR